MPEDRSHVTVRPVGKDRGSCSVCRSYVRVVEVAAGSLLVRFCQRCSLDLMGALASLYGVQPVSALTDNPELIAEIEKLRIQLNEAGATMRRLQSYVTQGN
jgi:hypothetical protein